VPNGEEYTVQVEYTDGSVSLKEGSTVVMAVGDTKTFKAPKIEGKVFQYWTLNGVKASYSSSYTIICAKPGTAYLQAVYGDAAPVEEPTLLITQTYTNIVDGKFVISNTLEYYAPEDYVVMEVGFVYSKNAGIYGVAGGADLLVLEAQDTVKHLSGFTDNEGIYTFNARTTDPDRTLFVKGYMICKTPSGEIITLYTDMKAGSYNGLNNPDGLEIIVVLDPASVLQASAEVPQDSKIEDDVIVDNVATLTILVEDTDPADVPFAPEEMAKAYDVSINGLSPENDTLILVTLEGAVPASIEPELLKAYHEGETMTQVESASALTAADSFTYDPASGSVQFAVEHFSNYTFVYPRDTYPITYLGVEKATNPNPASYMAGCVLQLQDPVWEGHTFLGWYEGETKVESISADHTGPVTLTASWEKNSYTVTFLNEDGTVLWSDEYDYGDLPEYGGDTPVKASTEDYTYTFAGWSPSISAVTGPATYTAVFTEEEREYGDPVWTWDGLSAATAT
ncbi:MAG: InlB B-repeat-containing protein, partial [Bacteroidales bacterium]|nr:InlB B-repeat-containing protein [Bacteroidales bacterium]